MAIAGELAGARFSLLTFDSNAIVRMPLTTDTSALDTAVTVLQPQVTAFSKGSSITAARKLLAERLRSARDSHPERPRLVYYLGDGEQTSAAAPEAIKVDERPGQRGSRAGLRHPGRRPDVEMPGRVRAVTAGRATSRTGPQELAGTRCPSSMKGSCSGSPPSWGFRMSTVRPAMPWRR